MGVPEWGVAGGFTEGLVGKLRLHAEMLGGMQRPCTEPTPPPLDSPHPLPQHLPVNLNFSQLLELKPLFLMSWRQNLSRESLRASGVLL